MRYAQRASLAAQNSILKHTKAIMHNLYQKANISYNSGLQQQEIFITVRF